MKVYINNIIKKEHLVVFLLFIFFFPLKVSLQNGLIYIFDQVFISGIVSDIFNYNYTGVLIGCEEVAKFKPHYDNFNIFQKYGLFKFTYIISIVAFYFLVKRYKNNIVFNFTDWFLTIVTCFSIFNTIEDIYYFVNGLRLYRKELIIHISITTLIFIPIGIFIFTKIFKRKERKQTLIIGLPAVILSLIIWFKYLGPSILPI